MAAHPVHRPERGPEFQVRLPESYRWAKDRRYPVLYLLDGKSHVDHTAASVAFLATHGEIPR
ncbi:MAG: hypothetical protein IPF66_08730 [Holophagales bacterium]|nr:hypothetical protein [Holophagales bacterium]